LLTLHLHQVGWRTFTSKLLNMPGTQRKAPPLGGASVISGLVHQRFWLCWPCWPPCPGRSCCCCWPGFWPPPCCWPGFLAGLIALLLLALAFSGLLVLTHSASFQRFARRLLFDTPEDCSSILPRPSGEITRRRGVSFPARRERGTASPDASSLLTTTSTKELTTTSTKELTTTSTKELPPWDAMRCFGCSGFRSPSWY